MVRHFFLLLLLSVFTGATAQPAGVRLDTLRVQYIDFEGRSQQGILICNYVIAADLRDIFAELYRSAIL